MREKFQVREIGRARARKENVYKGKREYRCMRVRQHVQVQEKEKRVQGKERL